MKEHTTLVAPPQAAYRAAMSHFPTGVALLTCGRGPAAQVMTVNCVTSVSLEPMLLLVGVRTGGRMRRHLDDSPGFAVNVLAGHQQDVAARFARRDRPTGADALHALQAVPGRTGAPLVPSAVVSLECRVHARYPGGDHTLFLGEVVTINEQPWSRASLIFYRSRYSATTEQLQGD